MVIQCAPSGVGEREFRRVCSTWRGEPRYVGHLRRSGETCEEEDLSTNGDFWLSLPSES